MLVTLKENKSNIVAGDVVLGYNGVEDIGLGVVIEKSGFSDCVHVDWFQCPDVAIEFGVRISARLYDRGAR